MPLVCRDGSGYITSNPYGGRTEAIRVVIGEKEYPILGAPKVMPFGTLQEASRYYELTHNPVNLEQVVSTTFANIFFSEEGATTPALFGTLEEMLTRIGKRERWQYGKERAEARVEAVEKAVFEILTEIDKGIMGARQVTRQVESFYAGK
jgi:hypothetical protein